MLRKTFHAALVLAAVIVLFLTQMHSAVGEEIVNPEQVLFFLRDVVLLDMTKYTATLSGTLSVQHREQMGGLPEVDGLYILQSETGKIEVSFKFVNNILSRCLVDVREGSPQYSQPLPADAGNAARGFLQRLQAFTDDPSLEAMRSLLDYVDVTKNITRTSGNLTLATTVTSQSSILSWKNTYNGAVFSGVGLKFQNGTFRSFGDDRSYLQIGTTEVTVSRDGAISIALERARNFSWTYRGEKISNFTIVNDYITAGLYTQGRDQPLVLYPYWLVTMPLDNLYPGFVTEIEVQIWADTGEIISIYTLGIGGDFPQTSPTPQPSQTTTEPSTSPSPVAPPSTSPSSSPSPSPQSSILASATPPSTTQPTTSPSPQPSDNKAQPTEEFPFILVVAVAAGIITAATATTLFIKKKRVQAIT